MTGNAQKFQIAYDKEIIWPRYQKTPEPFLVPKESKILHDFSRKTIAHFDADTPPIKGIFAYGNAGNGKTTSAIMEPAKAAIRYQIRITDKAKQISFTDPNAYPGDEIEEPEPKRKPRICVLGFWDFLKSAREGIRTGTDAVAEFAENDFLFLDDIKVRKTDSPDSLSNYAWECMNRLIELINRAEPGEKLLYATSNHTPEELAKIFDESFMDRMSELCYAVNVKTPSFRGKHE